MIENSSEADRGLSSRFILRRRGRLLLVGNRQSPHFKSYISTRQEKEKQETRTQTHKKELIKTGENDGKKQTNKNNNNITNKPSPQGSKY